MSLFKTKDEKKAAISSLVIHIILTLLFIFFGLTYLDPKPEDGIAIAFGYDADGGGETVESVVRETPQSPQSTQQTPEVDEISSQYTQDVEDAPAVSADRKKEEKKEVKEEIKNQKEEEVKPVEEEKPKIDDRLKQLTSNPNPSKSGKGAGTTTGEGTQGSEDGSGNTGGSQGDGGVGNSGNYQLGNRQALQKPKPIYDCPDEGRIVVQIYVDQQGRVVNAIPGVNIPGGTTSNTTSSCLREKARQAAMQTTWQSDGNAPDQQVGYITYSFSRH